jgi:chromatin licensing and DNA replication factor 1
MQHDDVPQHPLPERTYLGNSASKGAFSGVPAVTTCIPMEINTAVHRVEVPETDSLEAASTHFSRSFKSSFSSKAEKPASSGGSSLKETVGASSVDSGLLDTILPMPINRTPHRDVHTSAKMPLGTPHLAPSFSPFFSVKRSISEPELASESGDDDMPSSSVQLTPMKRRHAGPEEEPEVVAPVELQSPIKVIRACGSPRRPTDEMESPSKRPHFSPTFKPHFSLGGSPLSRTTARSPLSTPVKPSVSKEVPISWDVRTPGRTSDAVDRSTEEDCAGMKTPVKSSTPAHSFKSPAPSLKHQCTPCTPHVSEGGESSIYVSYHASQPGSACQESFRSPAATPVKQGSSSRSLNFASPKSASKGSGVTGTPCPCSPGTDVPLTPSIRTPVNTSRASRFRNTVAMKHSKLNLGPLFAQSSDDDAGSSGDETHRDEGADSVCNSCITEKASAFISTASASGTPALRKSLSFASEVSQADMNLIQGLPADLVHSVSTSPCSHVIGPIFALIEEA